MLVAGAEQFFVVPVERMYPLFAEAVPPARATGHTCLYLTSGTATLSIGAETCTIQAHEVLVVRAGQVYSFRPGDENTGFLWHFHDEMLVGKTGAADAQAVFEFLRFWGRPAISLDAQTGGFVENLLRRLQAEYETHGLRYSELLRAYLLALLQELHRAYSADDPPQPTAAATITRQFKQLVATYFNSLPHVRDYADRLHITPGHLTKSVRAVTGKAPTQWIEETIVLEAKMLLCQTALPVSEVAEQVGVADASYFSRLFKKHAGASPLAYRKKMG